MLDPKNLTTLTGNLVKDLEIINDNVIRGTLAVSYGGTEDGKSNVDGKPVPGYFDFVIFSSSPNFEFVKGQIKDSKMTQGSSVSLIGSLKHERFKTKEGQKTSRIKVHAEAVTYGASSGSKPTDTTQEDAAHIANVPDGW